MQEVSGAIVNKLTLSQYRALRKANGIVENESYVITDIDEQLDKLIIYKECLDVNNPIILRNLEDGFYKIYGYFKYFESQSGISGADPFALFSITNDSNKTYVQILDYHGNKNYEITDNSYVCTSDSGWITATLNSKFKPYSNNADYTPQYRKKDGVVYIHGAVSPNEEIAGSNTGVTIFTLPSGYRPTKVLTKVCQGSDKNTWLLEVKVNGNVTFARYGTTEYASVGTTAWLPFETSFPI